MKILLISGHGAGDTGALGNGYQEYVLTRELVDIIAPKLRAYATVDIYDQNRNAYKDVKAGVLNIGKYDYVLEIHFNAFNISAFGTECYVVPSEAQISVEQLIMKNMAKFFKLRDNDNVFDGVKRERFLVINTVKSRGMSGALLETCFIDNPNDMAIYQANKDAIAQGIVNGIVEGFGLSEAQQPVMPETPSQPSIEFLNLDPTVSPRTVYNLTITKKVASINPAKFEGLSYKIQKRLNDRYVQIKTSFGDVAICIDPKVCGGFSISPTRKYKNGD